MLPNMHVKKSRKNESKSVERYTMLEVVLIAAQSKISRFVVALSVYIIKILLNKFEVKHEMS